MQAVDATSSNEYTNEQEFVDHGDGSAAIKSKSAPHTSTQRKQVIRTFHSLARLLALRASKVRMSQQRPTGSSALLEHIVAAYGAKWANRGPNSNPTHRLDLEPPRGPTHLRPSKTHLGPRTCRGQSPG
jgi:hypothetical protein